MQDTTTWGGVDWAQAEHAVCVVDNTGLVLAEFTVAHTADGLNDLCVRLQRADVARVAIERPDGPIVDALMTAGIDVVVVSSRIVKALRVRYGSAGNKSDRSDAYVLADCLRTDGHRWASLRPDTPATVTLRAHTRARKDLVETRVATTNQLRALLALCFPGAIGLFADLDSSISLRFLTRFPSTERARWLSEKRLGAWLRANGYCGRKTPDELYTRLRRAPEVPINDNDERGSVILAYVNVITNLRDQISNLETHIKELLDAHPDAPIFQSLPRAGTVRAATLLAEIGDCRARFPDPESLACLAGVAPSTRASGKHHAVTFRWACDKKLRNAICDFAKDTPRANAWADQRYRQLRADGKRHPHAERILARTWCHIIWRCWQDHTTYDTTKHRAHTNLETPAA